MSLHRRIILSSEINGPDLYQYYSSPPLPTLVADSSTAAPFQRHISNAAIAAVSSVSAAIFLALTYYSVLRHRRRRHLPNTSDDSYSSAGDETSDDDAGGAHHAWNIRTVGLDTSAILSIGSFAYLPPSSTDTAAATAAATADCPVCLGELEHGDMVRLLPKCGHVFHVACIDTWLRAHVTCPLCRVHILPPQPSAAEVPDGETRVRVLSDTEAPPSPPPPPEDDPESPIDHRSVTTETEMEERSGEERKDDYSGEGSSKEVEVPSASGSGRVFFFARMSRGRSSSILPL